jgi:hypothetical protein
MLLFMLLLSLPCITLYTQTSLSPVHHSVHTDLTNHLLFVAVSNAAAVTPLLMPLVESKRKKGKKGKKGAEEDGRVQWVAAGKERKTYAHCGPALGGGNAVAESSSSTAPSSSAAPSSSTASSSCPVLLSLHGTGVPAMNQADSYKFVPGGKCFLWKYLLQSLLWKYLLLLTHDRPSPYVHSRIHPALTQARSSRHSRRKRRS